MLSNYLILSNKKLITITLKIFKVYLNNEKKTVLKNFLIVMDGLSTYLGFLKSL